MKPRKLGLLPAAAAFAMTFAWVGAASAATLLDLTGPIAGHTVGPQSESAPCVIAGTQCQNPDGFGFNNFTQAGNITSFDVWSTTPTPKSNEQVDGPAGTFAYTAGQITDILGSSFVVALDVNTTGAADENLTLFEVYINNVLAYYYNGPQAIAGLNNGNGWADWTLGTISLLGLDPNTPVQFHAVWTGNTDGAESFFLVSTNAIPEPETYAMMLVGFSLLGFVARRRKQGLGNVVPA